MDYSAGFKSKQGYCTLPVVASLIHIHMIQIKMWYMIVMNILGWDIPWSQLDCQKEIEIYFQYVTTVTLG